MYQTLKVRTNERVVLFKNSIPRRALGPGRHTLWGFGWTEQRFKTDALVWSALPEVRSVIDHAWFSELTLDANQRAVLSRDGVPVVYLRPGVHRYWTIDPAVKVTVYDVTQGMPKLTSELASVIPSSEYLEVTVASTQVGLLYLQGRFVETLQPGVYRYWRTPEALPTVQSVDMRRRQVAVSGQELMTRDKVTLRLTLSVEFAVADAKRASELATDLDSSVYLATQLAARDYVAGVTLDALLEGRSEFARFLESVVVPQLEQLGLRVNHIGVKDVVLPGEMKALLNRVIEAEKEAAANVILRREETAATRSLANTARVMSEQPVLLRLKELEAMKDIAERIHEVRVIVGADGLKSLLPTKWLDSNP